MNNKNIHLVPTLDKSKITKRMPDNGSVLYSEDGFTNHTMKGVRINENQYIYITSSEVQIKEHDFVLQVLDFLEQPIHVHMVEQLREVDGELVVVSASEGTYSYANECSKIVLTNDPSLIMQGVQEIHDDFLWWYCQHSSTDAVNIIEQTIDDKTTYLIAVPEWSPMDVYKPRELPVEVKQDKCEAGCKHFTGGEIKHHKDCVHYHDSISQSYDDLKEKQGTVENAAEYSVLSNSDMRANHSMGEFGEEMFKLGAKWQQERMYTEEEVHAIIESYQNSMENNPTHLHYDEWFKQFKKHK